MAISYAGATVTVFFEAHNLLHTPLSPLALRIYLCISYAVFQVCSHIPVPALHGLRDNTRRHYRDLSNRYKKGFLNGKRREAKETASKPSSEIDALILERILPTLDDDHALGTFLDAIPGFCHSKLSYLPLSYSIRQKLGQALDGFLDRTFSSSLISESVRVSRLITCLNAAHAALGPSTVLGILNNVLNGHWDEALQSVEMGHALRLWGESRDYNLDIQRIVACIVARVRERDDRWIKLVKEAFGVPDHVLPGYLAHGDSVLLFILIHTSRETNRTSSWTSGILSSLSKFDIRNTLPELQHEFCAMWNENVQDARTQGSYSLPAQILREIRHLYVALHQSTDAAPTAFSASADSSDHILTWPSSYPLCNVASHHPYSIPHVPVSLQVKEARIIAGPPSSSDPTLFGEIGDSSQAPAPTLPGLPAHTSPRPTDALPTGTVAVALKGDFPAATLSHPLEGAQRDVVTPAEPDIGEVLSPTPTPARTLTFASAPASTPPVLSRSLVSHGAGTAFNPLLPASSVVGLSTPAFPPQFRVPPLPNAEPARPIPPAPASSTPSIDASLGPSRTPRAAKVLLPSEMMPVTAGGGTKPIPSPEVRAGVVAQTPMAIPPQVDAKRVMLSPSPSVGGAGGMAPVLKFNGYGKFAGLLYHSLHSVMYEEDLYPTALHLFEARKFLYHRPDLAERIRRCERVEEITAMSEGLGEFVRRDWGNVALSTVRNPFYSRISHCACVWS